MIKQFCYRCFVAFKQLLQRLKRRNGQVISFELRPDGIAWCSNTGLNGQVLEAGFVVSRPAGREEALASLVAERGWKGGQARLVLSQDQYKVFQLERPDGLEDAELANAMRWKLKDLIDYSPSEAVCDVFSFPEDAIRGGQSMINVAVSRKALVMEAVDLMARCGLQLAVVDIGELALRNLSERVDPAGSGVALLFLRERHGKVLICKGDTLYVARRVDTGYAHLADVASQEPSVQALGLEMQRSLDYFESQLGQRPPRRALLLTRDNSVAMASMLSSQLASGLTALDWELFGLNEPLDHRAVLAWSTLLPAPDGIAA